MWQDSPARAATRRMIVLGIDGMDPTFLERHWDDLPELNRLRREGEFRRLGTTIPPQSPVAWSTFITGLDPGGHGIFDFVHRDSVTMAPFSSIARTVPPKHQFSLGEYILPLAGGGVANLREGTPFWMTLSRLGVPATILRMPTDFPPLECEAHSLAGMGTPDLLGTFGTFAFFTDQEDWQRRKAGGGEIFTVRLEDHHARLRVPGPANSLRKGGPPTHIDIDVFVDPERGVARFDLQNRRMVLGQGEWSEWLPVEFPLISGLASAEGMIRIYAKELHPGFSVYVSPVNIDPLSPAVRISQPTAYGAELASEIGRYYTQGMPYDTAALRHGVFTREEYLTQSRQVSQQTLGLLRAALPGFQSGLLFFHFFGIDQDSHMLWGEYQEELLNTYKLVDKTIGWVRMNAPDATLIVMSDHGFASFDRAFNLNTWLMKEGFLARSASAEEDADPLKRIDWTRTKAYALGLNGLYVNQLFRETAGIVAEGEETDQVVQELSDKLLRFRDPKTGAKVVLSLLEPRRQLHGDAMENAPDLIVGYAPGYRASWETALGEVSATVVEDNTDEWRGDHCIDSTFVPGVLLSNHKFEVDDPRIEDLTATILAEFGAYGSEKLRGRNLGISGN